MKLTKKGTVRLFGNTEYRGSATVVDVSILCQRFQQFCQRRRGISGR